MFQPASDDELMVGLAQGDARAFRSLFDRHGARVLGYCRRFMGSPSRGEDVAQDVWVKVVKAASSYRGEGKFSSWVLSLARNACLSELRKHSERFETSLDGAESQVESVVDPKTLERELEQQENLEELKRKIDALPDLQRAVLTLSLAEDLSYEEIASQLDLSVSAVKSQLFRARQNLQKAIRTGT